MSIGDEPAFPCITEEYDHNSERWKIVADGYGITLRDYTAIKAMQGLLAGNRDYQLFTLLAHDSYAIADAMLKAREDK